jgi:hypothetical protein
VRAAYLLFPFDQELDPAWKLPVDGAHRVECSQPSHQLALVVLRAASEKGALALCQLEGRAFPELERLWRLDVVVVVEKKRSLAAAVGVGQDDRVAASRHDFGFEAASS